jgi:uncharacterized protein YbjQ (UPF0145 family)
MSNSSAPLELPTSTTSEIAGFRIVRNIGVIRGTSTMIVKANGGGMLGGVMSMFGSGDSGPADLYEKASKEALQNLLAQAKNQSANAVIGINCSGTEVIPGTIVVSYYGTAVIAERLT